MAYRLEGKDIVIDGWEAGIGQSPYEGFTDMRNAEIIEETGEISVAFASAAVALPPVFNAVAYTAESTDDRLTVASVTGMYEGCAIYLNTNTATGLATSTVYYVRNISGLTFQVSLGPNSAIVDITVDGTGTLTTYQYGNQRSLTDNGAPVSYFHAPEIGGVLLIDSSNRAWLWQQGSDGLTAQNTLLFLGNITSIGASSENQVGICYWKGYVCIIQQPATIDMLNWEQFISNNGAAWLDDPLNQYLSITMTANQSPAANFQSAYARILPASDTAAPYVVKSNTLYEAGSSTTIVSESISLAADDILLIWSVSLNNITSSSGTFNGNAITNLQNVTSSGMRTSLWSYEPAGVETSTITITFASASTDRIVMYEVIRGGASVQTSNITGATTASTSSLVSLQQKPNILLAFGAAGKAANGVITFDSPLISLSNPAGNAAGCWGIGYFVGQGQTTTLKKNVPIVVGDNNILYWGSGEQYVGSLQTETNFSPTASVSVSNQVVTGGLTYTLNGQALDLPENENVQSLVLDSGTLMVGTDSKKVYPWDTISPSFDNPVTLPEPAMVDFVATNQLLYTFGGNKGRIYLTNTSSAELYREIPGGLTLADRPFYFFWDANVGNNELYFAFQAYENDAPDTALTTTSGVWAINSDTGALRMVQSTVTGASWVRMALPVADGFTEELLRPAGQGLLVGYSVGSAYYLDFSTSLPHVAYSTYVETEIIPVGTFFYKKTFEHVEFKLGLPLVSGEGIKIYQRSNLNTSYVLVEEFTEAGIISGAKDINWENVEWMQIKVEMKSTATTPSYVRLREVRIR